MSKYMCSSVTQCYPWLVKMGIAPKAIRSTSEDFIGIRHANDIIKTVQCGMREILLVYYGFSIGGCKGALTASPIQPLTSSLLSGLQSPAKRGLG